MAQQLQCQAGISNYALMNQALVHTVNDPASAEWLIGDRLDGIITDVVDRFSLAG